MKQIFYITFLMCAFCNISIGHNKKTLDSLNVFFEKTKTLEDSLKLNYRYSSQFRKTDSTTALYFAKNALHLSLNSGIQNNIQLSYYHVGKIYDLYSAYDKAISYYKLSLRIASKMKNDSLKATCFSRVGYAYARVGKYDSALVNHFNALRIRLRIKDNFLAAYSYNFIGIIYNKLGIYDEALDYLLKAKSLISNINNQEINAFTLINIGFVYKELGNYKKALNYQLEGLKIRKIINNQFLIAHSYKNIGQSYLDLKNFNKAIDFSFQALNLMEIEKADKGLPIILNTIGEVYLETKKLNKGKEYFKKANKKAKELKSVLMITETYSNLGLVSIKLTEFDSAKIYLKKGLGLALKLKSKSIEKECYSLLSKLYEAQNKPEKALLYHKKYAVLKDSIFSSRIESNIANLELVTALNNQQATFNWEKKKTQFKNEAIINQQKKIRDVLLLIVLIIILLAYFIYKNYRNKNKANRLLRRQNIAIQYHQKEIVSQNEKLMEMNREKDAIMGIVAHDLKAPLNKIKGLIYLLGMEGELNEQQNQLIKLTDKILLEGDRLIKDLVDLNAFEHGDSKLKISEIEIGIFLKEQIQSYDQQVKNKKITFHLDTEEFIVYSDLSFLSRILDNLISNAIKYSAYHKNIFVKSWQEDENTVISIKDQGPGLSNDDKKKLFLKFQKLSAIPTGGETSTGLGLSIVKTLIEKLKGEIEVISNVGKGAEFIVTIPNFITEDQ